MTATGFAKTGPRLFGLKSKRAEVHHRGVNQVAYSEKPSARQLQPSKMTIYAGSIRIVISADATSASAPATIAYPHHRASNGRFTAVRSPEPQPVAAPTRSDVVLVHRGNEKIEVIKAVRSLMGIGLKEAKDLVEAAPTRLKLSVTEQEAKATAVALEKLPDWLRRRRHCRNG
jgi:ribosomal protein L7/L12